MNYSNLLHYSQRIYTGFMLFLLCTVFLLSHSNQNSSQSLATLLLLLSPLLILFNRATKPEPSLGVRCFIVISVAIFAYALMIFFHHPVSETSSGMMRALSFYLLAPVAIYVLWQRPVSRTWFFWLAFSATFIALYPVVRELNGSDLRGHSSAHPIFWGNVCLTSAFLTLILSRDTELKVKGKYWLGVIGLCMGLTASFWSQTRGGWISIPLVLIALPCLRLIKIREAIIALILLVIVFTSSDMLRNRVAQTFKFGQDSVTLDSSTQLRLDMWKVSLASFEENPVIGNGLDGFSRKLKELRDEHKVSFYFEHPHNELMEVLSSRGIIGAVLLLILLMTLFLYFWNHRSSVYAKAGLISTLQFMIYSSSEIFLSTKFTLMYFLILQALLITACEQSCQENKNP